MDYVPPDTSGRVLMTDAQFAVAERVKGEAEDAALRARQERRRQEDEETRRVIAEQLRAKEEARQKDAADGRTEAARARELARTREQEVCGRVPLRMPSLSPCARVCGWSMTPPCPAGSSLTATR